MRSKRSDGLAEGKGPNNDEAADVSSGDAPAVVSEPSTFPLSVVKVAKKSNVGGNSLAEGSDENELSDEEHEKTVIDFGEGGLGLGDEFLLLPRFDFVTVHVVSLLRWERVASVAQNIHK